MNDELLESTETPLERSLKTSSLVIFGLAYLTPMVVLAIFGVIAEASSGAAPAAYLVAMVAMLFTANSYGKMARAYPVSGSAYTYVRKSISANLGFLSGWVVLLDYLFLPLVIWLIGASYLNSAFPAAPNWVWIVGFIVITSILNLLGVRVADRANLMLLAFQILVLVFFVALCFAYLANGNGDGITLKPFYNEGTSISAITAAAAVAAYSFLGFDAVTTLTEETVEPKKMVPRAVFLVALIGGLIFVLVAYAAQLIHPGGVFESADSAADELAATIGGSLFGAFFLAGLVLAQFASGIAAQASASRLMYAMGRDNVLPNRVFGKVGTRIRTPYLNIVIVGIIGLLGMFLDVATSTSFINFGAFLAFTAVNISTIAYYLQARKRDENLSRFEYVIAPIIGAVVCIYLLIHLDSHALIIGAVWLCLGVVLLAKITKGFRVAPPEVSEQ